MNKKIHNILEFALVCQVPLILFDFISGARRLDAIYLISIFLTAFIYLFFQRQSIKKSK
jgi:hypothetical protein